MTSVVMPVMGVRHMRMAVALGLVPVPMAVRAFGHRVVPMVVMPVIVPVCVLVFQRLVLMLMVVRLGQVQRDAQQHQQAPRRHAPAG